MIVRPVRGVRSRGQRVYIASLIGAHAVLVIILGCTAATLYTHTVDANIGGGLAQLALIGMGLPWTLAIKLPFLNNDNVPFAFAAASLNVLLHWFFLRWLTAPEEAD